MSTINLNHSVQSVASQLTQTAKDKKNLKFYFYMAL